MIDRSAMTVKPNPRIVALVDYAISETVTRINWADHNDWMDWAAAPLSVAA